MKTFIQYEGQTDPPIGLWWQDRTSTPLTPVLVNFSTGGYTFSLLVGDPGRPNVLTYTGAGITGAAGAGVEPSGTPNYAIDRLVTGISALTVPTGLVEVTYHLWPRALFTGGHVRDYPGDLRLTIRKRST